MNNTMGLSTEGLQTPSPNTQESTLPQNRPDNRMSVHDMPVQSTSIDVDLPFRHRAQASQDMVQNSMLNGQERSGGGSSEEENQESRVRDRPTHNGSRRPSERSRICGKCGGQLTGQFVRALGDTYHLECFTCHVRRRVLLESVAVCH